MNFDVTSTDNASREFLTIAQAVERLETKLKQLDRLRIEPSVQLNITPATRSAQQLQSRLDALRNVRTTVEVAGAAEARREVTALVVEVRKLRNARVRIDIDGNARSDVTALAAQLRALRNARVRVDIEGNAATSVAALATQLRTLRNARVRVDLDGNAQTRVAALATALRTLTRDVKVKVGLDDGTFARDIARLHQRVSALNDTKVRIEFEINPPGVRAELEGIAAALGRIRNTRARVDVDTAGAAAAVASLGSALGKIGKTGGIALSIPGILSLIGQVGSLGASTLDLVGILGLLPAAGFAGAAALATFGVGLAHVADALGPTGTPAQIKKVEEAMAALSPSAREAVTTIRELGPAWSSVRLDVQERLFAGIAGVIDDLARGTLPSLKAGLGGIATDLNLGAKGFAEWAGSGPAINDLNTILANSRTTLRELAPAGTNVAAALTDVGVVGSTILPELAGGATNATGRFRDFVAQARETGQLEVWIRGGITTLEQLGRIAGNTGGVLGSVFQASETAGYGFLDAVEQITGELDALLSSASGRSALVETFRESRDVVNALLPGLRDLAGAALDTTAAFARSDGLERFAGFVSQTATSVSPLVAKLGQLGGETLGALSGGASVAVATLSPLVGVVGGITDVLGPLVPLALASVVAFKGMALVAPLIAGLAPAAGVAAAAVTALFATMGTAASVGAAASAAVLGFAKALPLIAVGAIVFGQAVQAATGDLDGWAQGMIAGGDAARQARADFESHNAQFVEGSLAAQLFGKSQADLTAEIENQISALPALEQAQARAQIKQTDYSNAVRDFGSNSQQARDAASALADALDAVETETRNAENAGKSYADRLRDQAAAAQSALGANLQLEDALARVAQAERDANAATAEHGAGSEQAAAATREYVLSADQAAQAAQRVAEGLGGAEAGTAAYGATLLNLAANATGPARDAMLSHLSLLSQAELDSLSAGAAALGFATQIIELPDGKTVTVAVDPETGKIVDTQTLLDGMRDGEVSVNLETQAALDQLGALIGMVNGAAGSISINGDPQAAGVALQTILDAISRGVGVVTINGSIVPTEQALSTILGQIDASDATVTINGQSVPAGAVLRDILGAIAAGEESVTINGQSVPARSALATILGDVGKASAIMTILGKDGGVAALKAVLSRPSSSTHTITIRTSGTGPGGSPAFHDGGIAPAQRFHDGGVAAVRLAGGGQIPRPFRAGTGEVFPPRLLRITGDRSDVDEFYIPDNNARRSMALGSEWARRRGMELKPRNTMSTVTVMRSAPGSYPGGAARPSLGAATFDVRGLDRDVRRPSVDMGAVVATLTRGNAELRAQMVRLAAVLQQRQAPQVTQNISTPNPTEAGTASAMAYRAAYR